MHFSPEVDLTRIHPSAIIHSGCRISGAETSIGPDCEIGAESPVTLRNCQLGAGVRLGGGFADRATFLDGAAFGYGFHIRPGTLVEEHASGGHTIGLKQTVLFPFVTLGSLINFCDVFMAGGTGEKNHSEVGSSYIHFNFTPHQDKATASLIGDVPRGVLLREPPIFLGGQGGLVGPCRVAYGTVVAAGTVLRKDILEENRLITGGEPYGLLRARHYDQTTYGDISRIAANCFAYLENIAALSRWYAIFRAPVMRKTPWGAACLEGAQKRLAEILKERISRLDQLAEKIKAKADFGNAHPSHAAFLAEWHARRGMFNNAIAVHIALSDTVIKNIAEKFDLATDYIAAVRSLNADERDALQSFLSWNYNDFH